MSLVYTLIKLSVLQTNDVKSKKEGSYSRTIILYILYITYYICTQLFPTAPAVSLTIRVQCTGLSLITEKDLRKNCFGVTSNGSVCIKNQGRINQRRRGNIN